MASLVNSVDYCGLSGWYWYCDEHDAHGIADSEDEAAFVMDAHVEYQELHGQSCRQDGLALIFRPPAENEGPSSGGDPGPDERLDVSPGDAA